MATKLPTLKKGTALLVRGPIDKAMRKAFDIAYQHGGCFTYLDVDHLFSPFGLGHATLEDPETIIVEGFPKTPEHLANLKRLITMDTVTVHRKMKPDTAVRVPNFIFCTGDANAIKASPEDRRFTVVEA